MKKFLLLLCTLLGTVGAWATVTQPTLTTDPNNPTYYVIKNFRSGKYANYVNASTQMTQEATASLNTLWYFVENGSGVSIVPAADPTVKLATVSSATADGAVWYVAENKINKGYFAISLNSGQNSNCWDANSAGTLVGTWQPSTTDYAGTSWVIAETVVTKADIDGSTLSTALSNSSFAIQKAEAIARLGALSSLAVYTDANLTAARNASDASALNTALEAFNTNLVMLCRSNKYLNVGESGGSFETTQSVIQLVSAGGGAFYLKGKSSEKYLGSVAASTAIGSDDTPTTAFYFEPWNGYTVAHPTNTSYYDYQYIHNGGSGCVGWNPAEVNTQFTISEPFLTGISEVNANKAYYITTADRGAWMVENSGTAVTSTTKAGFAPMKADPKQQFAFIAHNNNYYLYSVSAKKFVSKSGSYTTLTDIAGDNVSLLATTNTGYPTVVAFQDGAYQGAVSNNYTPAVITFWNDLNDGGNQAIIAEVADFDPTEALETFNTTVDVTYEVRDGETLIASEVVTQAKNSAVAVPASLLTQTFVYDYTPSGSIGTTDCTITVARTIKSGVITSLSGLSNSKAYRLVTERGTFTTDNGELANTAKSGSSYTIYNFAIVYYDGTDDNTDNGHYYLWSVQDSRFVAGSGTALTETPTAITLNALTGPLFKFQCGSNYMNCNANGCSFGSWSTTDAGNSVAIIEAADFDPTPVINAITNVASSVVANIKPFFDAAGSDLFQLKSSVASAYNETYTAALTMCSTATYDELLAVVSNADNFNLPQAGKFYLVKNNYNGKYMRATASGVGNVKADLTAEEAAKDASAHFTFVENASHLYMSTQGVYLNWVWGRTAGYEAQISTSFDKYVHFAVPAPGVGAFSIAYGNGVDSYAGYLGAGFYTLKDTETKVVAGSPTDQTHEMAQWTFEEVSTLGITLNGPVDGKYYATLCVPFDITALDGATAYTLAKVGTTLNTTEINSIPAGTPVLLEGTAASATATIAAAASTTISTSTALTGQYFASAFDGATNYTLGTDDSKIGFFHWDGTTLAANRAYIAGGSNVKGFYLNFDEADKISEIAGAANEGEIYNLAGQRLNKLQRGVNIVNGKKVLVK
ncbi:MAG: RICIN domain-containing protein [Bacteroidaceae bacterium]|nr:RICIN domain-containing protein [Bacteroidaceae bacterium]